MTKSKELLSVVIPAYNEEKAIYLTLERVFSALDELPRESFFEVLVVDDGSMDGTGNAIAEFMRKKKIVEKQLRTIHFVRNYGHTAALLAGYQYSKGDYIVSIDADLQDPPELIPSMLALAKSEKADVVQGYRDARDSDTFFKKYSAQLYYLLLRKITGIDVKMNAADYRLLTRQAAKEVLENSEKNTVLRLLIPFLGLRIAYIPYERKSRIAGESKYNFSKMLALALDSAITFTNKPLRFLTRASMAAGLISLMLSFAFLVGHFLFTTVPGWTSIIFFLTSMNFLSLMAIAIVGEYVGKIYLEVLDRPFWRLRNEKTDGTLKNLAKD